MNKPSSPPRLVAVVWLALLAPLGCHGGEPPAGAKVTEPATAALQAELDKAPKQVRRAIATLQPGPDAKAKVAAALKASGAAPAQDLAPQPMLVIEVNAAQLRAVLATGRVLRVQPDSASPTN